MGFVGATARVWLGRENKGGRKECIGGTERIFLLAQTDESDWATYILEKQSPMCHG
jgi:hypothetical protein